MNPLLYDFRRTLSSRTMLALCVVIILLSLAFIPAITTVGGPSGINSQNTLGVGWLDQRGYNYIFYSYNLWGDPLSGTRISVVIGEGGTNYTASGTTNSSGYAQLLVNAPAVSDYSGSQSISVKMGSGWETSSGGLGVWEAGKLYGTSIGGGGSASIVADRSNSSRLSLIVLSAGADGSRPEDYGVFWEVGTGAIVQYQNDTTGMTRLGTLADYVGIFPVDVPGNISEATTLLVDVTDPSGAVISSSYIPAYELATASSSVNPTSMLYTYVTTVPNMFIPLLAIIAAYSSFGRDRVSGVIESVLVRPVSRRGLTLSRYLSTVAALSLAISLMFALLFFMTGLYSPVALDVASLVLITATQLVVGAAFVGLIFVLSYFLKSTSALVGVGIGIFVVFGFFWNVLVYSVASSLGATPGSAVYLQSTIAADFFNPAQLAFLLNLYLSNGASYGLTLIQPGLYRLTPLTLALDAMAWVAVPLMAIYYVSARRD
ncbi:MAG TPA: ABC transporter permease subunit [Conexivisphaerales archaeon]|nr:ABC transporter permease subunit [Conexivisphaerales archaeon]